MNLYNYNSRPANARKNPLSSTLSNHLLNYPTPSSLTYNWSYGSLAGLFFAIQIVTGIFLAMHYTPHVEWAFQSVEHIMTDVTGGYLFRYFHANGASAIFILIYAHMARGLYYQSYLTRPVLWATGVLIFLLMMATAFIGYVLPWGQMSFWGATVITSLVTAVPLVGEDIAYWVWGGFSVGNATLTRFFSLHFVLPFAILGIILFLHLMLLHTDGSTEPFVLPTTPSKVPFHPYYTLKDTFIFYFTLALFGLLVFYVPNLLGHSDNFLPANPLVTPAHIVPEWYFTPYYAILRACPHKIGGALGMFAAIVILAFLKFIIEQVNKLTSSFAAFATAQKVAFWVFVTNFLNLIYLGSSPAAAPYVISSKASTGIYFGYFLIVLPLFAWLNKQVLAEAEKVAKTDSAKAALFKTLPITPCTAITTISTPTEVVTTEQAVVVRNKANATVSISMKPTPGQGVVGTRGWAIAPSATPAPAPAPVADIVEQARIIVESLSTAPRPPLREHPHSVARRTRSGYQDESSVDDGSLDYDSSIKKINSACSLFEGTLLDSHSNTLTALFWGVTLFLLCLVTRDTYIPTVYSWAIPIDRPLSFTTSSHFLWLEVTPPVPE